MSGMMPRTLGKYRIIEEIGRGGMAVVYKAVHPVLGRYVAIKVLPPQFTFEKKFVERFRREATAASTLNHPNIVIIHDVDQEDDIHYIVMEYLEGQPLSELIKEQGSLPLSRALKIMHQISSALDYAHSLGFVHRDIKPSNIIIGPEDHATLTDFGIVRTADGTSVTKEGAPIGTPEYMSPEQCDGKQADSRSDVYSLGVVLYEMVTGQVPFTADTPLVVMYQQVNKKPVPPRRIKSDLSGSVEQVVMRALAKTPEERYPTAGALAEALEAAIRGEEAAVAEQARPDVQAVPERPGEEVAQLVKPAEPRVRGKAVVRSELGKYRIIEEIDRGPMGVVYKGLDPRSGSYVAIKVLARHFTSDKEFVRRLHREATAASKLRHPNIVIIHDVDEEDDIQYIVMEYLEGQPLSELIKMQGSLPSDRAFSIIRQISSALDYAHSLGFVHRDIKPTNIIIGPEDHATLTDFSIVATADGTAVTKEGASIGTPEYMSPEQCDGKQADSRSDIYSLGVVLYEMLTGQVPFTADTPLVVMYQQVNKKPVPPRRINSDLSEPVEGVVLGALAKAPGERYQTAGALAEALEAAIRGEEPPAPAEPVPDDKAVESLYMRALAAVEEKRWQEAIELLNQVLLLDEHYRDARVLLKRAEEELSDVLARARRDAEKDEAERARLRRAEELRKQAKRFIHQEQWEKAVDCLREAISLAPENREIASLLAQAEDGLQTQKEIEDLCREGTEALKAEDWEGAIERFSQVLLKRPSHKEAREKLEEARRSAELARKYDAAQELMAKANWPEAIRFLEEILADEPGYKDARRLLDIARAAVEPLAPPVGPAPAPGLGVWQRLRSALGQPNARILMACSALLGFVLVQIFYWLLLPRFSGPLAAILPPDTESTIGLMSDEDAVAPGLVPTFTQTATATHTATPSPTATSTTTNTPTATPSPTATALPPTPTRVATPRPPTPVPATPTAVPLQAPPGMIYMPAGETRAADGGVLSYEAHFIDDHAVTWGEYEACVRDTYCARIAEVYMLVPGEGRSYELARIQNYMPVHRATWYDADRYCRWAGKRLTTLAEWRNACENASRWNRAMLWATGQLTLPEWVADPVVGTEERVLCVDGCYSAVGLSPFDAPGSNDALWDCLRGPDPAACSRGFRCARTVE